LTGKDLNGRVVEVCKNIANGNKVIAIVLYGSRVSGYARQDSDYDVLLVIQNYSRKIQYHYRKANSEQLAVLAVDGKALEADAEKGALGDFVAGRLLAPYVPLYGAEYIRRIEVTTKKRFAIEELEDLIIEYGELARGLIIKPEYLVLARMEKRAKTYPPLRYSYIRMLQPELRERNIKRILDGYYDALRDLNSKIVWNEDVGVRIRDDFVDNVLSYRMLNKVVNIIELSRRAFNAYITHGRAGRVTLDVISRELASKLKRELLLTFHRQVLEDPKNYLFIKTARGLQSLSRVDEVVDRLRRMRGSNYISAKSLAGTLNEVYLAEIDDEKFVVKRFTDWYNIKWFILNVASYGTKVFSLQGRTRLSNEYLMNRFLADRGFPVPEIVSVNLHDRMLVERYIEGKNALSIVSEVMNSDLLTEENKLIALGIGRLIARIHSSNIVLGDCKPENFIIGDSGSIYVVDLEQSKLGGDASWDVAEYLYFSGHFGSYFSGGFSQFIDKFIEGYLSVGESKTLKNAASVKYSRIFLPWTPVNIIQGIVKKLRQI
jgi:tRNA A-37 threonylcarbamoyl transferase component Bud32/predicted nucleotidyltransferase